MRRSRAILLFAALLAGPSLPAGAQEVQDVEVSRVRPSRAKHETLRFLKENRDFIRSRIDLLRERPVAGRLAGEALDPRFLEYGRMLAAIRAGRDSAAGSEDARARRDLYASVRDLGTLEDQLDQMERLLAAQRGRLGRLEADFTGLQGTAWLVVLSGHTASPIDAVVLTMEDGRSHTATLTQEHRDLLERGGAIEIAHARIEPREQVVAVRIIGRGWAADTEGFVTLTPERDRLTCLRFDLTGATPGAGAPGVRASRWTHEPTLALTDGSASAP